MTAPTVSHRALYGPPGPHHVTALPITMSLSLTIHDQAEHGNKNYQILEMADQ